MKKFGTFIFSFLAVVFLLNTSCTLIFKGNGNNSSGNNDNLSADALVNYNFKISNFPYDSSGLVVMVQSKLGDNEIVEDLGIITKTDKNAYIQKTVKLPNKPDSLYIFFVDRDNNPKYSLKVVKEEVYDASKDLYDINGWYNIYYKGYYFRYDPFCGAGEGNIRELELDKQYEYKWREEPYLLFSLTGMNGKKLFIQLEENKNIELYYSTSMEDILTYNGRRAYDNPYSYNCETDVVYFMLRPGYYDYSSDEHKATGKIKFLDYEIAIAGCLEIKKSILASDGKIYVSGSTWNEISDSILYCFDPALGKKTVIKDFGDFNSIKNISEIEEGFLYVAHGSNISKVNLSTKAVTNFVQDLPIRPQEIIDYKDNMLFVSGNGNNSSSDYICLVSKTDGSFKNVDSYKYENNPSFFDIHCGSIYNIQYDADDDIFFYNTLGTPKDICFLKILNPDQANPTYYTEDSQYHVEHEISNPTRIFIKESAKHYKIISGAGELFNIDLTEIEKGDLHITNGTDYTNYVAAIKNWCLYEDNLVRPYDDCYITQDYIYYLQILESKTIVEKSSKADPLNVIQSEEYTNEKGISFYKFGNKLYLLSNDTRSIIGARNLPIYLHEITF